MPLKKLAAIAAGVVLFLSGLAQAKMVWWKADSKIQFEPLYSVSAGDSLHVWAAGFRLTHSTDGGISWSLQSSSPMTPEQIDFIDSLRGWGATGEYIFHTSNGGQNWMVQNDTGGMTLRAIEFIDSLHGVAIGSRGGVPAFALFTSDGGLTWRKSFYPLSSVSIHSVKLLDTNHVWVGGNNFFGTIDTSVVFFSSDWGATWQARTLHDKFEHTTAIAIDFIDTLNGYILSQYGNGGEHYFYRTSNGGLTWTRILELSAFSNWTLCDMDVVDTQHIWMAGSLFQGDNRAGFLSSFNGGASWDTTLTGKFDIFGEIEMFSNSRGWVVGGEGLLYAYVELILGDLDMDKEVTAADVVLELNKVFLGQPFPAPQEAADVNCDGLFTAADVVLHLNRTFLGITSPPWCGT